MRKRNAKKNCLKFTTAAQTWLEYIKHHVKRSTYENYVYLLNKHILPYFGELDVRRINCAVINDFTVEKLTAGKIKGNGGLSKKYLQDILSVVKSVANFCEQEYGVQSKIHKTRGLKARKPEIRILDGTDRKKLSKLLKTGKNPYNIGIMLSLYTGIRIGEACGLKWGDFNEAEATITIRRTVQRISDNNGSTILLVGEPKTEAAARVIPLPKFLCGMMSKMKQSPEKTILSGTEEYAEPSELRRYFKDILKQCDIEEIRYHDLRHTFASNCVQLKFDTKTLSEILGHSSVNMTLNRYVHSSLVIKRKYMNMLDI